jgi:hypothetical protein
MALIGPDLFVANVGNGSITELNAATRDLVRSIPGRRSDTTALLPFGSNLFVGGLFGSSITELTFR